MKDRIGILAATAVAALFTLPATAQQVTMMTGPQGGSWIPLGGALKNMWEAAVPGLQIQQQPGAGIANVRGVDEGKAQIGFANSSIGYMTHIVAACDLPEDVVYKMTKAMASHVGDMAAVVKPITGLTAKDMAVDIGVPFHKGAAKYYKEVGAM